MVVGNVCKFTDRVVSFGVACGIHGGVIFCYVGCSVLMANDNIGQQSKRSAAPATAQLPAATYTISAESVGI